MTNPINYVAGLMFSEDQTHVALIEKQKPDWQRGKLNAIGGKIEDSDEDPGSAMVREFREETGATRINWRHFCTLRFRGGEIYFFAAVGDLTALRTMEEEKVQICHVDSIWLLPTIPNLRWLVPMALDKDRVTAVVEDQS